MALSIHCIQCILC